VFGGRLCLSGHAGAYESLKKLGGERDIDLVVVTSRQHVIQDQTLSWIDKHYPGIFQVRGVAPPSPGGGA